MLERLTTDLLGNDLCGLARKTLLKVLQTVDVLYLELLQRLLVDL
jgi:hypothetical protein